MKKSCDNCNKETPISEYNLVCSVTGHLVKEGYKVRSEVSNMGQSIDLVATKNRHITAIEAKKYNWRRALEQCQAHTLVADYIVLAVAIKKTPTELTEILREKGWGLLKYEATSDSWCWDIKPTRNSNVWQPQRQRFSADLRKVNYVA